MSKFFINRPIVALVIAIVMVIVGAISIVSLPIAQEGPVLSPVMVSSLPIAQFPNIAPP